MNFEVAKGVIDGIAVWITVTPILYEAEVGPRMLARLPRGVWRRRVEIDGEYVYTEWYTPKSVDRDDSVSEPGFLVSVHDEFSRTNFPLRHQRP